MKGNPATLTGLAIGDALGQPFEFTCPGPNWLGDYVSGSACGVFLEAGQWTDDTKMAIALSQSLINNCGYNQEDVALQYVKWLNSGDLRGIGVQTQNALYKIATGTPVTEAGVIDNHGSYINFDEEEPIMRNAPTGNGTVMRIAPLGLFYRNDFSKIWEFARKDAVITHIHKDAIDASVTLAHIIAMLSNGIRPLEAVKDALGLLSDGNVKDAIKIGEKLAFQSKSIKEIKHALGREGTAHATLGTALFCLLRYCDDGFKTPVVQSIMIGGDTDTRGAIVGALMGTYVGSDNLPEDYLDELEHVDALEAFDKVLFAGPDKIKREKLNG